jgi:hypothetical protein
VPELRDCSPPTLWFETQVLGMTEVAPAMDTEVSQTTSVETTPAPKANIVDLAYMGNLYEITQLVEEGENVDAQTSTQHPGLTAL